MISKRNSTLRDPDVHHLIKVIIEGIFSFLQGMDIAPEWSVAQMARNSLFYDLYLWHWTSPGGKTPQGTNYTATCLPSRKLYVRQTRHAGHCLRSRDELISDVLLWTPTYGRAKAGRPARTYIQQLCEDTGCSPEDLPEAMDDREKWRERARDTRASGTTAWWWWLVKWAWPTEKSEPCLEMRWI